MRFYTLHENARRAVARVLVAAVTAGLLSGPAEATAQPREAGEYAIKAAFLYNFTKFVEWPEASLPNSDADMAVCVLGIDPIGDALEAIRGKSAGKRRIAVRHIRDVKDIGACHVLYVGQSEGNRLEPVLKAAQAAHALTVSDLPQFVRSGGMISLFTDYDKVRFSINAGAAERAGLRISSHLLKLAVAVIE